LDKKKQFSQDAGKGQRMKEWTIPFERDDSFRVSFKIILFGNQKQIIIFS
jgi:hypothetical protein